MPTLRETGALWLDDHFWPEAAALFEQLVATVPWDDRIRARRVASFGVPYNYSGTVWPSVPFPAELLGPLDRVAERLGYRSNNCLANYYPDGRSTMGYHADATEGLAAGTGIAILSLGAMRTLSFRRQADRRHVEAYPLRPGSLLFMTAELQRDWKHAILTDEGAAGRISLTFRCLTDPAETAS